MEEIELEVIRDANDVAILVCSIENFDSVGVHTGDSITLAPAMTLTDAEFNAVRDLGIAIIREVGLAAGGLQYPDRNRAANRAHGCY